MNAEKQTIIERVQKLLGLANDKGATDGEIAAAAAAAKRLLNAYQLTLADVQDVGDGGAALEEKEIQCGGQVLLWRQVLSAKIAAAFDVMVLRRSVSRLKAQYVLVFVGRVEDVEVTLYFYNYLERALRNRAADARLRLGGAASEAKQFNNDFICAAAKEIQRRLTALYCPTPAETALAVRKQDALKEWVKANGLKDAPERKKFFKNLVAAAAGRICGREIALNRGLPAREPALFEA
jgi:hypothetical protein